MKKCFEIEKEVSGDRKLVLSIVLNGVVGDSRVIKTAKAAEKAGYRAVIFGLGQDSEPTEIDVEGTRVILFRNAALDLKKDGAWQNKPLNLLVEAAVIAMGPVALQLAPQIIHSHDMLGLRVGAALSRLLGAHGQRVRWLHDLHEYVAGLTHLGERTVETCLEYERRYLRQADDLVTVSAALARTVTSFHYLPKSPELVLNAPERADGFPDEAPDVRSSLGLPFGAPLVVYVGTAKRERGCETLVKAVASLPGVHLCFVSNSERYLQTLSELAASIGAGSRFYTHPYVPSDQVSSFIRTADAGLHGMIHYPNGEVALPNKLFEYLQADVPVVLSDVAAMKQFIEMHPVGCIFEAENADACARAIRQVLANKDLYKGAITGDLKREYSWQMQSLALDAIYSRLAAEPTKRNKTLVLSNSASELDRLRADLGADVQGVHFGLVSSERPDRELDFYLDPNVGGDLAGMLTWIADRYDSIHVQGSLVWPSPVGLMALVQAGVAVTGPRLTTSSNEFVGPVAAASSTADKGKDRSLLGALEQELFANERQLLLARLSLGMASERLETARVADAKLLEQLSELRRTNRKLKRAVASTTSAENHPPRRMSFLSSFRRALLKRVG